MSFSPSFSLSQPSFADFFRRVFLVFLGLVPLIGVLSPRVLAVIVPLCGLYALIYGLCVYGRGGFSLRPFLYVLGPLLLAGLSSLWAIDPGFALERTGKAASVLLPGAVLIGFLLRRERAFFDGLAPLLFFTFIAALLFNIFELYFQGLFYQSVRPEEAGFKYSNLNRPVVVTVLCCVPVLLMIPAFLRQRRFIFAAAGVCAGLLAVLSFLTYSQSAHLALALMAGMFFLFPGKQRAAWILLGAVLCVLLALTPFLTQWMFQSLPPYFEGIDWFRHSYAAARLEIWDFVSRYALERPWTGHGIEATRAVEAFDTQQLYQTGAAVLHPHNFAVQLWVEFGVFGALLGSGFLALLLRDIYRAGPEAQKIGAACLAGCLAVAATGYGLWQGWWLGLFFMVAAYAVIAITLRRNG